MKLQNIGLQILWLLARQRDSKSAFLIASPPAGTVWVTDDAHDAKLSRLVGSRWTRSLADHAKSGLLGSGHDIETASQVGRANPVAAVVECGQHAGLW